MILCTFALLGTVGCGNNSADNAADQTMQDKNGTNRKENGNVNDATAGTDNDGDSILEDAGNAVGDVVDDIADGVSDITDDVVGGNDDQTAGNASASASPSTSPSAKANAK